MRPSRVFRLLFRIFISLLTLSVTVVSILGGLSAVLILSNPDNVGIDPDSVEFNLDFNYATREIENVNFTLPFNFTNAGYFDLENLELEIQIGMNYSHVNWTAPGVNGTRFRRIFEDSKDFGDIPKGKTKYFTFFGDYAHFSLPNTTDVDWLWGPPTLEFYANFTVSLDYSIRMHHISITLVDLHVLDFTP